MRLIDADTLKNKFWHGDLILNKDLFHISEIRYLIDNAPTVEPKKGEKIANNDANFDDNVAPFFCSRCLFDVEVKDNYCWFCGADLREVKMKGGDE